MMKMISKDTIKLLRECDSGIKMGIASIEDVLGFTKSETLKDILEKSRKEHYYAPSVYNDCRLDLQLSRKS